MTDGRYPRERNARAPHDKSATENGEFMEYAAFVFGIMGMVAFVRVEKLVKTLKEQGVLDQDYKDE